jgi:hypothetical protein
MQQQSEILKKLRFKRNRMGEELLLISDAKAHRMLRERRDLLDDAIAHIEKLEREQAGG